GHVTGVQTCALPIYREAPDHPRFGTSDRIINIIVLLQIVTIVISRGDVTFLANLYAFGVIWSFTMNGLAVLVLRYTHPGEREFRSEERRVGKECRAW